jgi:DNA-directed RNA polymerase beta subunit
MSGPGQDDVPDFLRAFDDTKKTRQFIYDGLLDSVKKRFPVENDDYRVELTNVRYTGPQSYTLKQQKDALMKNRKLQTAMSGTWRLIDKKTNKVIDERDDVVMQVPYYTDRGTIINNGNEYTVVNQSRLRPGVYARRKTSGEYEAQFNVKPGTGPGFRIEMSPDTGVFTMSIGQGHIPLYPVLKGIGVDDKTIAKYWGNDLALVNAKKHDSQAMKRLYGRLAGRKANPLANELEMQSFVRDALARSEVDSDVVQRTMGLEGVNGITPQLLLRASQKVLNISRGDEQEDKRDSPRFSNVYSIEDFLKERVDKDSGKLSQQLLWRAKRDRNLGRIPRAALNPYIEHFLNGTGLALPGEEANPISNYVQMNRITKMGQGGIGSDDAITMDARDVQGDYLGFVDPVAGPESARAGVDVRAASNTFKGNDGQLYSKMLNLRTGKNEYVSLAKASDKRVAFPGQDLSQPYLYAMKDNVPTKVPRDEVDYVVPDLASMSTTTMNLVPLPTAVQGARMFYASKFWEQYLPQVNGEVPLVDSLMPDGKETFSEHYGKRIASVLSDEDGIVTKVDDDRVVVKGADGKKHEYELIKYYPHNRMSATSYFPSVQVGQEVRKGDLLAHSNFTDAKTGAFNTGRNLKVAMMPYGGSGNFEDAIVISESAAKKLATEQLYGFDADTKNGVVIDKKRYMAAFPQRFTKQQFDTLDDSGVVKPGTVLQKGDPIIASIGPKLLSAKDAQLGKLSKALRNAFTDRSEVWEHDWPGTVVDVATTAGGAKVNVVTTPPKQEADKLSPRFALKGTIGKIIPDDKMPRDAATNEPFEILMNPMGVLSRVAPAQLMEIALAKVAHKTGKQIRVPQLPPPEGWAAWTKAQMDAAGVSDATDVFDPETGKTIKGIGDGYVYIQAFHHLAEKKLSARGSESAYTQDESPARGGYEGAKRVSQLDRTALLSHGATEVLKDMMTIRGTKNEEYWNKLRLGLPVPEPGVPFIYNKFMDTLRAGGINVVEKGNKTSILPMTDKDIDKMTNGRTIKNSKMMDSDLRPAKGGLFDEGTTGGPDGNFWSAIQLPEPIPNPIMEEPVKRVLGLTTKQLEGILAGTEKLDGKTGGEAIKDALSKIDVDKAIETARSDIKTKRGANRDNAVKVLGYLKSMQEQGLKPVDWMISKVPVLPPKFRPVSKLGDVQLVSDMNDLYKDVIENAENYSALKGSVADESLADERLNLYKSVAAAFGLGDPITTEGQSKNIKGAIRQAIGTGSPKFSMFQSKVIAKNLDSVGRAVITPDENLDMDQIGIPEDMAWDMYKPYVQRNLVRRGYNPVQAVNMIHDRTDVARQFLEEEMDRRPVLMDRAPTWHKFNIMAFRPHIVKGKTIKISPFSAEPMAGDFDGDQVNIHVPSSEKAVKQALDKMLPSKNLISLTDLESPRYKLSKEQVLGLFNLTQPAIRKAPKVFRTVQEAKEAYRQGLIGMNDPITVLGA